MSILELYNIGEEVRACTPKRFCQLHLKQQKSVVDSLQSSRTGQNVNDTLLSAALAYQQRSAKHITKTETQAEALFMLPIPLSYLQDIENCDLCVMCVRV